MHPTDERATILGSVRELIGDESFTVSTLAAVAAAAILAFGFGATAEIIVAMLVVGAVTAAVETHLRKRN